MILQSCDHECVCWWYYEHKKSGNASPCASTKCHHRSRQHNPQAEREKVLRPEVLIFAFLMERKLRKHDKDRGDSYKTTDVDYLLMRLREEVKELHDVIEDDPWDGKGVSLGEAVDVGNISMMIGYHDYQFPMGVFIEELVEELHQSKDGE